MISIVIPSYRSEKIIEKVITAIFSQKTTVNYEVILVDSTPGEVVDDIALKFKKLIFLKQKNKTSASEARNIGAEIAQGQLLLFVDSDVTLEHNVLDITWERYVEGAKIFSGSLSLDKSYGFQLIPFVEFSFYFSESFKLNPNKFRKNLPSTLLAIDKNIYFELGGFKEFGRIEDTILTESALKKGHVLSFFPEIEAKFFQEVTLKHFLDKCRFNGINLPYARFGNDLNLILRFILFFSIPIISFVKLIVMIYRNLNYRDKLNDKLLFIFILPIIFLGIIYWMIGGYYTVICNKGVDYRR